MLNLALRLAISTVRRTIEQIEDVAQDLLLSQAGDNIITQNGNFVALEEPPAALILAQTGDFLHTQDNKFIETASS